MQNPGPLVPFTIRSLAEASGVKRGTIERLLNGTQRTADVDDAIALAETLGVSINPLFAPPSSPKSIRTSRLDTPTSEE
ncbi:helix-turn-helix domain-containing protein [Streptomyces fungicidicus]|uniref:helix-turn-helix domain-containing protein n=1 Tax=Streptomyces fungicidicus TaxID=68203 RepID=UPI0037F27DCD